MPTIRARLLVVLIVLFGSVSVAGVPPATAAPPPGSLWFDDPAVTVRDGRFTDAHGREIVLRGYNVSGETKLAENKGLPFASAAATPSASCSPGRTPNPSAARWTRPIWPPPPTR
jgi:hypothetical protein